MVNEKHPIPMIDVESVIDVLQDLRENDPFPEYRTAIREIERLPTVDAVVIPNCRECAFDSGIAYWHQCEKCLGQATNNFLAKEAIADGKAEA